MYLYTITGAPCPECGITVHRYEVDPVAHTAVALCYGCDREQKLLINGAGVPTTDRQMARMHREGMVVRCPEKGRG